MAKSKMPNRSKRYPPEFHRQLVELHRAGRKISELSREFGVSEWAITRWVKPLSIHDILDRAGQLFPNSEAVTRLPDKTLVRHRYAHIAQRAHALAHALQALGINRGETVATLCWTHHVHLECYFGVPLAGAVLHTL